MSEIQIGHWTKLGSTIRDARTRRKWSQHELAAHAQVSRSWVAKMEAGHRGAELEPLLRLLAALDLSLAVTTKHGSDAARTPAAEIATDKKRERPGLSPEESARHAATAALIAAHQSAAAERRRSWDRSSAHERSTAAR